VGGELALRRITEHLPRGFGVAAHRDHGRLLVQRRARMVESVLDLRAKLTGG
jgi:hypothetical protein